MIQVNLLPWREQTRLIKRTRFMLFLFIGIFITMFFVLTIHFYMGSKLNYQFKLNDYLQSEIDQGTSQASSMSQEEKDKADVEAQLRFIIDSYNLNYSSVRLLNELDKAVPSNVMLTGVQKDGSKVVLTGEAGSDSELSQFAQDLGKNAMFEHPTLSDVKQNMQNGVNKVLFSLTVEQKDSEAP